MSSKREPNTIDVVTGDPPTIIAGYLLAKVIGHPRTFFRIDQIRWFGADVLDGVVNRGHTRICLDVGCFTLDHPAHEILQAMVEGVTRA